MGKWACRKAAMSKAPAWQSKPKLSAARTRFCKSVPNSSVFALWASSDSEMLIPKLLSTMRRHATAQVLGVSWAKNVGRLGEESLGISIDFRRWCETKDLLGNSLNEYFTDLPEHAVGIS